jgi:hypothetical protein
MNYNKIESISLERNNLKKINLNQIGNKHRNYVLCTDPDVKIKGLKQYQKDEKTKIVFSKGVYYSDEQEIILEQFFQDEKDEKRIVRENILAEIKKMENN